MPDQFPDPAVSVVTRDGLRVHTVTAPDAFLANSTHVLETDNALVVIDGQFIVPYAQHFRRYVDGLAKPIAKMFLSHSHVDHWFGIAAGFSDVQVTAAAQTIAELARDGETERAARAAEYGPLVPDHVTVPGSTAVPGVDEIDGVKYELDVVADAECGAQLLITLPDHGVTVAQDLVYSGTHVYVTAAVDHSLSVLQILAASGSDVFLAGHGPVADRAELDRNAEYLSFARDRLADTHDPAAFKNALLTAYPNRSCPELLDIFVPRLFATGS
jgi:glyoxylase-like metal-dependent hydrolase (beta-lactamase superfamily II)